MIYVCKCILLSSACIWILVIMDRNWHHHGLDVFCDIDLLYRLEEGYIVPSADICSKMVSNPIFKSILYNLYYIRIDFVHSSSNGILVMSIFTEKWIFKQWIPRRISFWNPNLSRISRNQSQRNRKGKKQRTEKGWNVTHSSAMQLQIPQLKDLKRRPSFPFSLYRRV